MNWYLYLIRSIKHILVASVFLDSTLLAAQTSGQFFKAAGSPVNPKVDIPWYRYYDSEGLAANLKKIVAAHPQYAKLQSIGKSSEGLDIWCITITDFSNGNSDRKPGVYIQGNIHGNEIQGSEVCLYTAWYLTEMVGDVPFIKELLANKVFYIVPTLNPGARDMFMHSPANGNAFRGLIPGNDPFHTTRNKEFYNDLDGDGSITAMRKKDSYGIVYDAPGAGYMHKHTYMKQLPIDSMEKKDGEWRAKIPNPNNFSINMEGGKEGADPGFVVGDYNPENYDLNRNWGWIRDGAHPRKDPSYYRAFCYPETRAVRDFFLTHPNIVATNSYHNFGGTIGSGVLEVRYDSTSEKTPASDSAIMFKLGTYGGRVTGYRYLETRIGGGDGMEVDWMYGARGAYSFQPELMTERLYFHREPRANEFELFIDELLFGDSEVPWHETEDPKWGKVEVGGMMKNVGRIHAGFQLQEEAHRQTAFNIRLAHEAPLLIIKNITVASKGKDIREITATIENTRLCGTHSEVDLMYSIARPDYITLKTPGKIISAGKVGSAVAVNKRKNDKTRNIDPSLIMVDNIPGHSSLTVRWIVKGGEGNPIITVDSIKGGLITAPVKQ